MSVPYGAPQQQPGPAQPAVGVNLNLILPLVAAGLGLIAYLLAFADDVPSFGPVEYLLAAGVLAGLTVLPKALRLLPAAVVLSAVPTLLLLQSIIKTDSDVEGMQIVLLIIAVLETAAIVVSLLMDAGIMKLEPKPANPYGQPGGWSPQSAGFPQQGQPQHQQYGPPSGQFGQQPVQPQQPGQPPQQTTYMPQPGQFGQPGQAAPQGQPGQQGQAGQAGQQGQPGTPPSGFGQQG